MSDLDSVLSQIRERIARYRARGIGEQNTKSILIEPLLRALDWDTEDYEEVRREYKPTASDNPVDYALFIGRTPRLFVEAKALGGNLNDRKWAYQIMSYAAISGVEWVVLTDGDEYRIYNSHATVPIEEKLFRSARITDRPPQVAETFSLLSKYQLEANLIGVSWESHFVDRRLRAVVAHLISENATPEFVDLLRKRTPELSDSQVRMGLARLHVLFALPQNLPSPMTPQTSIREDSKARQDQVAGSEDRLVTTTNPVSRAQKPDVDKTTGVAASLWPGASRRTEEILAVLDGIRRAGPKSISELARRS